MIKPMHDNVLVQLFEESEKKIGSIIVQDSVEREYARGKVLEVGPGLVDYTMQTAAGDLVIVRRGTGTQVGGLVIVKDKEILAREDGE